MSTANTVQLDEQHVLLSTMLPDHLIWDEARFDAAWNLHPEIRHQVKMFGKWVEVARRQQAYGATYAYSGSSNRALPVPEIFIPLLDHVRTNVDERLNGILLNWYDGPDDYIGDHHDDVKDLITGSPIVTASFGERRTFRLTRGKGKEKQTIDQHADNGRLLVMPWETNLAWKHSVPKSKRYAGRRISVTFRAFSNGLLPEGSYFAN